MKYTAKQITIEANEIVSIGVGDSNPPLYDFALKDGTHETVRQAQCGDHVPQAGDFFIKREDGDNYLCPANVFNEKYELGEDTAASVQESGSTSAVEENTAGTAAQSSEAQA